MSKESTETDDSTDTSTDADTEPAVDADETADEETTPGFSASITSSIFTDALDPVSVLVDECKIHLNEDGLAIRAVDPANVGMVDLTLEKEAFESYTGNGGIIGVNLSRLEDIAAMADNNDTIFLDLDQESHKLHTQTAGLEYTLALIDPESIRKEPEFPDLDLSAKIVAEGSDLDRGVKASDMVSDHIRLAVDAEEEAFIMSAEGDTDDVHLNVDNEDLIEINGGAANSVFSLDYLKQMNIAIDKNAAVTVELGEEFPVKIDYDFAAGMGHTTYMLAPRIQND
jgi:proliferating cell nuclear antigen